MISVKLLTWACDEEMQTMDAELPAVPHVGDFIDIGPSTWRVDEVHFAVGSPVVWLQIDLAPLETRLSEELLHARKAFLAQTGFQSSDQDHRRSPTSPLRIRT